MPLAAAAAALAHPAVILSDESKVPMNACCCVSIARNSLLTVSKKSPVVSRCLPLQQLPNSCQLLYSNRLLANPHEALSEKSKVTDFQHS